MGLSNGTTTIFNGAPLVLQIIAMMMIQKVDQKLNVI